MALAELTGSIRDFTRSSIAGAEAYIHPQGVTTVSSFVLADKPIPLELSGNGSFSVELEDQQDYVLEILFPDPDRSRIGRSQVHEFRMPSGGGDAGGIIGPPVRNGMVRVVQSDPSPGSFFDQYVYNELTGDLFERRA